MGICKELLIKIDLPLHSDIGKYWYALTAFAIVLCNKVCEGSRPACFKANVLTYSSDVDLLMLQDKLCTPSDILEEKSPLRVCQTVESLLEHAEGGV